jgi:transposase InsO family protein
MKEILDDLEGMTFRQIYDKYGVARETIRRWKRYRKLDVQCKTTNSPEKQEDDDSEFSGNHPHWKEAVRIWKARPGLGPAQIRNQLHRAGIKITVTTVRNVLLENGYSPPKPINKEVEINRYEACRPREIVHMDFNHFYINKQKVYLLFLQDDYSRFICGYKIAISENMVVVIEIFEECVSLYGKMQTIMTDAGSSFYCWNGINKFQRLVMEEYGIDQIKAGSPRSNGKVESVNKQFKKEVLKVRYFHSLEELNEAIIEWIAFYNFERTHMGLPEGMAPADRFLYGWNNGCPKSYNSQPTEKAYWQKLLDLAIGKLK